MLFFDGEYLASNDYVISRGYGPGDSVPGRISDEFSPSAEFIERHFAALSVTCSYITSKLDTLSLMKCIM
jgi:hypothetical protein